MLVKCTPGTRLNDVKRQITRLNKINTPRVKRGTPKVSTNAPDEQTTRTES